MRIKESTAEHVIIDSEKGYDIKLSNSALSYLHRDDDGGVSFDFNPSTINVFANGIDEPKHLFCLTHVRVDNILGNDVIRGYKDGNCSGAPVIINFESFKLFEADRFDCINSVWNLYVK